MARVPHPERQVSATMSSQPSSLRSLRLLAASHHDHSRMIDPFWRQQQNAAARHRHRDIPYPESLRELLP